jgi:S-adenosylmethionine:tRNA ribosyltransferase-isomerase
MKLLDFDYDLPRELIAQTPLRERSASRLLHLDGVSGRLADLDFTQIVQLIAPEDVLILNDTRVIKARLHGRKTSGGKVELLVERVLTSDEALVQMRASHSPREGSTIVVADAIEATVLERRGVLFRLRFRTPDHLFDLLDRHGSVPLPPYIEHEPDAHDGVRYQTVYARAPGAVAAPTAGLHFDQNILSKIAENGTQIAYVTLHVGAGTFQPVRESDLAAHEMHAEWYTVPEPTVRAIDHARQRGGRVVAVGTTTLRALESAGAPIQSRTGETKLFIVPGYRFQTVDRLITNFHLPKSTLLMLVSAFGGTENIRRAYAHAIRKRYRFFSYGDAMLIERTAE